MLQCWKCCLKETDARRMEGAGSGPHCSALAGSLAFLGAFVPPLPLLLLLRLLPPCLTPPPPPLLLPSAAPAGPRVCGMRE